jgi:hypothetical protein
VIDSLRELDVRDDTLIYYVVGGSGACAEEALTAPPMRGSSLKRPICRPRDQRPPRTGRGGELVKHHHYVVQIGSGRGNAQ